MCQCFSTPNAVFLSTSISLKWIISKFLNNANTSSFNKNTTLGFVSTHESFIPKKNYQQNIRPFSILSSILFQNSLKYFLPQKGILKLETSKLLFSNSTF